jgi:hypothetical protein
MLGFWARSFHVQAKSKLPPFSSNNKHSIINRKLLSSYDHNIRGSHTTSENEKLLRILMSQSRDVIHGSVVTPLWGCFWHGEWIYEKYYWIWWLYRHWSQQQEVTAYTKLKRSKSAVVERWKMGAENEESRFFTSRGEEGTFSILRRWISPSAKPQSRLAMCLLSENKSGLGSGVTTPIIKIHNNVLCDWQYYVDNIPYI